MLTVGTCQMEARQGGAGSFGQSTFAGEADPLFFGGALMLRCNCCRDVLRCLVICIIRDLFPTT